MAQDHIFNSIKVERPNRNTFDLSHAVNMSFDMGHLVPCCCIDMVPGDKVSIGAETMLRFSPLIAPIMSKVNVTMWYFAVPDRILFDNPKDWEEWIVGEGQDGHINAYISNMQNNQPGTLLDHLYKLQNLPGNEEVLAAPAAAYFKIYDDWFRNQNITDVEKFVPLNINENMVAYRALLEADPLRRTWEKDYFTAALPWAQKGDAVTLPLLEDGGNLDVELSGVNAVGLIRNASDGLGGTPGDSLDIGTGSGLVAGVGATASFYDPNGTLSVPLSAAAATVNQLRMAYRLQEYLELDAMGGTRYTEKIYAHFGVKSPDSRLQRPELLGRWTGRMSISEVLQTSAGGVGTPLGTMGGHGISLIQGDPIQYYATEHCWLIGIINVQPKPQYSQGIQRKFLRFDHLDYFWPKFAHVGEQEIKNRELYAFSAAPDDVFGYTPRYAEYRYEAGTITGQMRTTLAHWHTGRIFDNEPALNEDFVNCNPTNRIFNIDYDQGGEYNDDQIFGLVHHNIYMSRLMPKYGRPTL
ncbi:putative major capsid protein [Eel River basin pequenovirus]|nr:putative major capsid protein [Eel River basin pequenovirus]